MLSMELRKHRYVTVLMNNSYVETSTVLEALLNTMINKIQEAEANGQTIE